MIAITQYHVADYREWGRQIVYDTSNMSDFYVVNIYSGVDL